MTGRTVPTALNVIAILFLLMGIAAVFSIVAHLTRASLYFNFDVLGIPIFIGLRSFSAGWRICALVYTWASLILAPIITILSFTVSDATFSVFGIDLASISPLWLSAAGVLGFLFALWQYHVLTRPDIRVLFYPIKNA